MRTFKKILQLLFPYRTRYKYLTRSFASEWAAHVKRSLSSKSYVLHYEDMCVNPYNELKKLINYIDPSIWNEKIVNDAIEIFSFDNMTINSFYFLM